MLKRWQYFFCALVGASVCAHAQISFDNSGNGLLKGTSYFREVIYVIGDNSGNLGEAIALYGNITYDGNGNYTMTGSSYDSNGNSNNAQPFSTTGTYAISAAGLGSISSPVSTGDSVFGLVSNGIFIGSSTEAGFNDLFISSPVASPVATNSTFQGTYQIAEMDFPTGNISGERNSLFQATPDGNGNLGALNLSGYIGASGSQVITQSISGAKYSFSNGAANVTFGGTAGTSTLLTGGRILYISPDGNFVFGGNATGWDMFVGVKTSGGTGVNQYGGLYYQAGLDVDDSTFTSGGYGTLDTYYGSFNAANGNEIGHQRLLTGFSTSAYNFNYSTTYALNSDGTYTDPSGLTKYVTGANGKVRIGLGVGPYLGINVALQAPSFAGSGVFLNPAGVVNAASSAPFTTGISRGELITLYGTNLASKTVVASTVPFPTELGAVQVLINGRLAPLYVVSPNQISVVVPYATELTSAAQITIYNNGIASNAVTVYTNLTTPGVFTNPAGGIGSAAALHSDGSLVTGAHPAQPGETIAIYLTGLGDVLPAIVEGSAGPSSPLSVTTNTIAATIGGTAGTITYAGLAPGLAGLYQLNVTIPSTATAGNEVVEISGPDSDSLQSYLPVGSGVSSTASASPAPAVETRRTLRRESGPDDRLSAAARAKGSEAKLKVGAR